MLLRTGLLLTSLLTANLTASEWMPPDSPHITLAGRWDRSQPQRPWCAWQGSTIRFTTDARQVLVKLDGGGATEYFRVIIDHETRGSRKFQLAPGEETYELARDLKPGRHHILLMKESYLQPGRTIFLGLQLTGGQLLPPPTSPPRLHMEFYGDSNLAGYSLEHERNRKGAEFVGCYRTFAGITARALGASFQNISSSGAGIADRKNSVLRFHGLVDYFTDTPKWDFRTQPADICILNVGANDIQRKTPQTLRRDFLRLLDAIRTAHPQAHIVLMNGYGWDRREPANFTTEVIEATDDENVSRCVFPWFFNEWHGCEYDHAGMAAVLLAHLEQINPKWRTIRPLDVMNGFAGRDVANGGFEEVAPFGGFAWRYADQGVERVHDPKSPQGEWHLRLPQGATVHQPQPATVRERLVFGLKARSRGQEGAITLQFEFRDQQWRHEIPHTRKTVTLPLTNSWQALQHSIQIPSVQEDNPSFAPWQVVFHLQAEQGSVDVDDIHIVRSPPITAPPRTR